MTTVLFNKDENGVAILTLNRPEKHNAFDDAMIKLFRKYLTEINRDDSVRCVILNANGKHFCAGADFKWMQAAVNYSEQENYRDSLELANLMYDLYHLSKPTIAVVHGAAFGGGNYQNLNNGENANNDPENNHKKDVEMKPVNSTEQELKTNIDALAKQVHTLTVLAKTMISALEVEDVDTVIYKSMLQGCNGGEKSRSRSSSTGSNINALYGNNNNVRDVVSEDDLRDGKQNKKELEGSSINYAPGNTSSDSDSS